MKQTIIKSVEILMPGEDWEIVAGETVIDGRTVMGIEQAGPENRVEYELRAQDEDGEMLCMIPYTTPHICYCETIEVD